MFSMTLIWVKWRTHCHGQYICMSSTIYCMRRHIRGINVPTPPPVTNSIQGVYALLVLVGGALATSSNIEFEHAEERCAQLYNPFSKLALCG
mmetsp:Transcript_60057/g.178074  ORF Transcript_60057/g.178074 Transcript_60057/m.178074 type:complete len:92 (+) Transcript_60057:360-635(+)